MKNALLHLTELNFIIKFSRFIRYREVLIAEQEGMDSNVGDVKRKFFVKPKKQSKLVVNFDENARK